MHTSKWARFWCHMVTDHRSVRRAFPPSALKRIETAIASGERGHAGQVEFVVEAALPLVLVLRGQAPRERALEVFGRLRVWDTEENCGVLVYLLLADKAVEIVADRGIHRRVGKAPWTSTCHAMEKAYGEGRFEEGTVAGIDAINALLIEHFPRKAPGENELPDKPVLI